MNLDDHIAAALDTLRELGYAAHCEWDNNGRGRNDLLTLSNEVSAMLNRFSSVVNGQNYGASSIPTKINTQNCQKKIQAIKAVREYTGHGLKDAKDIVDESCLNGWVDLNPLPGYSPNETSGKKFIEDAKSAGFEVK